MIAAAYMVDDGNSTRAATPSEIAQVLGIPSCSEVNCEEEKENLRRDIVQHRQRAKYIREHADEIQSMLVAGIDEPIASKASELVLTDSSFINPSATTTALLASMTAVTPSRPTSEVNDAQVTGSVGDVISMYVHGVHNVHHCHHGGNGSLHVTLSRGIISGQ